MKKRFIDRNFRFLQILGPLAALVILTIALSIISHDFRSMGNALTVLRQASINGLIAFGMTCVILTGAIDLSVGAVLGVTAMFCAGMVRAGMSPPLAMLCALGIGTAFGIISGSLVAYGRLQPFIATLVTMIVLRGITLLYSGGRPISNLGNNAVLYGIGKGTFLKTPVPIWILITSFFVIFFFAEKNYIWSSCICIGQ